VGPRTPRRENVCTRCSIDRSVCLIINVLFLGSVTGGRSIRWTGGDDGSNKSVKCPHASAVVISFLCGRSPPERRRESSINWALRLRAAKKQNKTGYSFPDLNDESNSCPGFGSAP